MSTETIPALPPVPADLAGWAWEVSPAGDGRLANAAEGYATSWGPLGPEADAGGRIAEARRLVARDAALAAEEVEARPARPATTTLPHGQIRTDGGTQPRAGLDREHIGRLRESLLAGEDLPPLTVFYDGEGYWLADGFHRLTAWREQLQAGGQGAREYIACEVRQGSRRDAVLHSVGANRAHGLPRSREDLRRAIETLLRDAEWGAWSDREIARRVGCSHATVGSVRAGLVATGQIDQLETRQGADGKARALPQRPPSPRPDFTDAEIEASIRAALLRLDAHAAQPLLAGVRDPIHRAAWQRDIPRVAGLAGLVTAEDYAGAVRAARGIDDVELRQALVTRYDALARPAAPPPVAGVSDRPLDDAELGELSRLGGWELDLSRPARPGKVLLRLCRGATWDHIEERSPEGWRYELQQLQAAEHTPPPATRAARLGEDPPPALPPGWSWRERPDGAAQAWDGTIARLTACHPPARAADAAAEAWRRAGGTPPADAPPAPPEFAAWAERARALGGALARDAAGRYVLTEPDGQDSIYPHWIACIARVRHLETTAPPPPPADAEEPDAIPADARASYAQAERALADDLRAAPPRLRRLLQLAWGLGATDYDEPLGEDELFDELTGALLAATDEALAWALGERDSALTLDDRLGALLESLDAAEAVAAPPDAGDVARWQDALDALVSELDDATYERLAHRLGELRRAGEGA